MQIQIDGKTYRYSDNACYKIRKSQERASNQIDNHLQQAISKFCDDEISRERPN